MKFAILASPRTGSTSLCRFLTAQPEIHCHGEVFKPSGLPVRGAGFAPISDEELPNKSKLGALRETDAAKFLDSIYSLNFGKPIVGFKIFRHHDRKALFAIVRDPSIKKIVLYRPNTLACYASTKSAIEAGRKFGSRAEKPATRFESRKFMKFLKRQRSYYGKITSILDSTAQTYHVLKTDDLGDRDSLTSLLEFLGTHSHADRLPPRPQNKHEKSTLLRFTNRADVRRFLKKKGWLDWRGENGDTDLIFDQKVRGDASKSDAL